MGVVDTRYYGGGGGGRNPSASGSNRRTQIKRALTLWDMKSRFYGGENGRKARTEKTLINTKNDNSFTQSFNLVLMLPLKDLLFKLQQ